MMLTWLHPGPTIVVMAALLSACDTMSGPGTQQAAERTLFISHTGIILAPGDSIRLSAWLDPPQSMRQEVAADRWWSDDESVVRATSEGSFEAIAPGRTTVWVEFEDQRDSARVVVRMNEEVEYRWRSVAVGEAHVCALAESGQAYCWGTDVFGELGAGARGWITATLAPSAVTGRHQFQVLTAGSSVTCGLDSSGAGWCWGSLGLTGSGVQHDERIPLHHVRAIPEPVDFPRPIVGIWSSYLHSCLLDGEGKAYCWGSNLFGQLGLGHFDLDTPPRPTPVDTDLRFTEIRPAALSTCALAQDGTAHCWGENMGGAVGIPPSPPHASPQPVTGGHAFRALARTGTFGQPCAIEASGATRCWGSIGYGLEHEDEELAWTPAALLEDPGFERVVTGGPGGASRMQCGLMADGRALCWGWDHPAGILGAESVHDMCRDLACNLRPTPIAGDHRFRSLSIGAVTACGVTVEGALYCWGSNDRFQLGLGRVDEESAPIPTRVPDPL